MEKRKNPKVLPSNFEAEQSLLGSILIDNSVALEVLSDLRNSDFYYSAHQNIFEAMRALQASGTPIDFVTVNDKLSNLGLLEQVGDADYLADLTNLLPSSANFKHYFDIVKRDGMLRKIIGACTEIIENAYSSEDSDMSLAYAEKTIFDISDSIENKDLIHIKEVTATLMKGFEDKLMPGNQSGLRTGFFNLDDITHGYQPGQMIVLAARPGVGKTSFAMNIVHNIMNNTPEKVVAVFNLEMSVEELGKRLYSTVSSVPSGDLENGASPKQFMQLWNAKRLLDESNLFVDDTTGTTPEQIMSKCRRLKQLKKRLDFVVIDYLQLLKSHTPRQSIQQEVSEISRSIKIMAKELKVPILILSQTSRDLEKRPDKTPKLSDLRDSGAIEQDADQVYFLVKDEQAEGGADIVDLVICKHRSGSCGTCKFLWTGNTVKFKAIKETDAFKYQQKENEAKVEKASEPLPAQQDKQTFSDIPQEIQFANEISDKMIDEINNYENIDIDVPLIEPNDNFENDWENDFVDMKKNVKIEDNVEE